MRARPLIQISLSVAVSLLQMIATVDLTAADPVEQGAPVEGSVPAGAGSGDESSLTSGELPSELNSAFQEGPGLEGAREFLDVPTTGAARDLNDELRERLRMAQKQRLAREFDFAFANLQHVLESKAAEKIKQTALLELAFTHQDAGQYPQALKAYGMFLQRYPDDPGVPEVLLRQGVIYRSLGVNSMALSKFHSVMTSALSLNLDELDYYRQLVLMAQTQIADTYYLQGKLEEAVEKFLILLKLDTPLLDRALIQYKVILCHAGLDQDDELINQARNFLTRHPDEQSVPHVRYLLSRTYKRMGRDAEAMEEVLGLLKSPQARNSGDWKSWQQRTGNEIANQLYREGDYVRALEIYLSLEQLDESLAWRLPLLYQVGLIYERLDQPELATRTYERIVRHFDELGEDVGPGVKATVEMARWRIQYVGWRQEAEKTGEDIQSLRAKPVVATARGQ